MTTPPLSPQDLRAAAEAHRELGSEYSDAVVDSFLEKIDARLDARVNARLAELSRARTRPLAKLSTDQRRTLLTGMAIGVGGVGVPLSLMAYNAAVYISDPGPAGASGPRSRCSRDTAELVTQIARQTEDLMWASPHPR